MKIKQIKTLALQAIQANESCKVFATRMKDAFNLPLGMAKKIYDRAELFHLGGVESL